MKSYTVKSVNEAWNKAAEIMSTDYSYDAYRSTRAGYGVYYNTSEGADSWVSDLGSRLEVNLPNGESVNIWIAKDDDAGPREELKTTTEGASPLHSVARLDVSALYAPTVCQRVTVCIMGGRLAQDDDERRVYDALKNGYSCIELDIIARWCECRGVQWGTISRCNSWHFDHGHGEGHFIVEGFVSAKIGHEIEFLKQCAALLSAEYAKSIN